VNLSAHFTLDEFCRSQTAARSGRELIPTAEAISNLKRLCVLVLEPLRIVLGRPIVITSGYRPPWLNTLIGGAKNSAHLTGRAADIRAVGMSALTLARFIERQNLPADKVILEFDEWVHVQVSPTEDIAPRRQYLTASHVNGRTQYTEGLV
jgi:zinc D-Ala-D-Ala carboxypeptidase